MEETTLLGKLMFIPFLIVSHMELFFLQTGLSLIWISAAGLSPWDKTLASLMSSGVFLLATIGPDFHPLSLGYNQMMRGMVVQRRLSMKENLDFPTTDLD